MTFWLIALTVVLSPRNVSFNLWHLVFMFKKALLYNVWQNACANCNVQLMPSWHNITFTFILLKCLSPLWIDNVHDRKQSHFLHSACRNCASTRNQVIVGGPYPAYNDVTCTLSIASSWTGLSPLLYPSVNNIGWPYISIAKLSFFMRENAAFKHLISSRCRLVQNWTDSLLVAHPMGHADHSLDHYCPSVCVCLSHVIVMPQGGRFRRDATLLLSWNDVSGARWRQAPTACCRRKAGRRPPWGSAVGMAAAVRCRAAPSAGKGAVAAAVMGVRRISVGGLRAPDTSGRRCVPGRWDSSRRY